jgi:glycosyltransferase involved in cell wall biosynthesis
VNILLLSGSNPYNDAGIWAYDIYNSLSQHGHSVLLLTRNYDKRFELGIESIYGKWRSLFYNGGFKILYRLRKEKTIADYCMHSLYVKKNYIPSRKILMHLRFKVDVIIYLFPHRFLTAKNLFELNKATQAPIFIFTVDMAQFTGGCHYANNCEGYKHSCGKCPGLYSNKGKDLTYKNMVYKKNYINKTNIYTLANTWTSNLLKQSTLYSDKMNYNINVVVNENVYKPGNKKDSKNYFSIPAGKSIIFFGATSVQEKRKGFSYLVDALGLLYEELSNEEREVIRIAIAGDLKSEIGQLFPFEVYLLGHLPHDQLSRAFQMSDVFVSPSIQDAGPMMIIQSMMCGTPVVAFEMGSALDFIIDGKTGYKVPLYDTIMLKNSIYSVLKKSKEDRKTISEQCRKIALSKSSYNIFERDFMSIYKLMKRGD